MSSSLVTAPSATSSRYPHHFACALCESKRWTVGVSGTDMETVRDHALADKDYVVSVQALPNKRPDTEFVMLNGAHAGASA